MDAEFRRYKAYGEGAFAQLSGEQMNARPNATSNSIAMVVWHMSGNFASRFTDFLTSDGEKPWRQREEEFAVRAVSKPECLAKWNDGWAIVLGAVAPLTDGDLGTTVYIRRQPLTVRDALLRSLAHASYHVGQIVYVAKSVRDGAWDYLTIPPGGSDAYNRDPRLDRAAEAAARISPAGQGTAPGVDR